MERVTGIGGVFVPAADPERLSTWYADHLGVAPPPTTYEESSWRQEAGPTVFAPMRSGTGHPHGPGGRWSLNFRVRDLDAMVAQLRGAGITVRVDPQTYPNGRFADLEDPEANAVQLWQPAGADSV